MAETVTQLPVCPFYSVVYFHRHKMNEGSLFTYREVRYHILTEDVTMDKNRSIIEEKTLIALLFKVPRGQLTRAGRPFYR